MTELSEAALEQREQAAVKHGAYAFRDRGEQALEPSGRTRLAELREQVKDRQGVIEIAQEKAVDSVLLFEIIQSYVVGEVKKGKPLAEIPAVRYLPAFMNSMQRALYSLISLMPKDTDSIDAGKVLKAVKDGKENK